MKTTLYYFSGTGNSLKVAKDLCKELEEGELISIAKTFYENEPIVTSEKVGFIFPLYYYGLPKIIYDFVTKIKLDEATYIFAVVTRAGDVDGVPLIQLEKLLRKKSRTLNSGFFVMMPDNFILLPSTISDEEKMKLFEKANIKIKEISKIIEENKNNLKIEIIEGKKHRLERGNLRFHKNVHKGDESFFADEACTSCGTCEDICPVNNINIVEGKPQWLHECQQCLACINYCPEESIQYGKNTAGRPRYHHPEITVKDLINQKK